MTTQTSKRCKDCGSTTRQLKHAGPRCGECHRKALAARREAAHEAYVLRTYNMPAGAYRAMYEAQGGVCYICRTARGLTRWLCVDHDHTHCAQCDGPQSCGAPEAIRGLLCTQDNKLIGRLGPDALRRAATYLEERSCQTVNDASSVRGATAKKLSGPGDSAANAGTGSV